MNTIEKYFQQVIREKYNFTKEEEAIYIAKALNSTLVKNVFMEVVKDEYNYKISNGDYDHLYDEQEENIKDLANDEDMEEDWKLNGGYETQKQAEINSFE